MPHFICPNCAHRTASKDRAAGFSERARSCQRCGFGFLFELLDDYYPAPNAAFFTCDRQGRLLDVGKGGFELTGLKDEDVIGRPVQEVLGLKFLNGTDEVAKALEWGVRVLDRDAEVRAEGDLPAQAKADIFPAYDEDGGLLIVLTPK